MASSNTAPYLSDGAPRSRGRRNMGPASGERPLRLSGMLVSSSSLYLATISATKRNACPRSTPTRPTPSRVRQFVLAGPSCPSVLASSRSAPNQVVADRSGLVSTVISAICPKASPRVKATFPVLIRKIHEDVLGRELLALMDRHSFRPAHI